MDVVNETKEKVREATSRDGKKGSLAKRALVPLAASAVSGAAAYAVRKAPGFFQEKVLPKLKEVANGGTLDKAKEAVEGAVSGVSERVTSVGDSSRQQAPSRPKVSAAQHERNQRERAKRRRERKQALAK
jgi:hypothetical protein